MKRHGFTKSPLARGAGSSLSAITATWALGQLSVGWTLNGGVTGLLVQTFVVTASGSRLLVGTSQADDGSDDLAIAEMPSSSCYFRLVDSLGELVWRSGLVLANVT